MKHRFKPLRLANESDASGQIGVVCCVTKKRAKWNDACRAGWVADLNGKAFVAYYSPEGRALAEAPSGPDANAERARMDDADYHARQLNA